MLADEYLQPGAQGTREQHARQQNHRAEQENRLQEGAPAPPENPQQITGGSHGEQVEGRAEQGCGMEQDAARHRYPQ